LNPREELARLAVEVRAHAEWQMETGATGSGEGDPRSTVAGTSTNATTTTTTNANTTATTTANTNTNTTAPSNATTRLRLVELADEVRRCTKCGLHSARTQTVFARGSTDAELCFVGEGPGADEDRQGFPFVGKAGQLLDRMIAAMGFARDDVYVCNIVKCRPPDNRKPEPDEMAACKPYLREQLELVAPKVIVALGATAVEGLIGMSGGITRLRGQWKLYRTIPVMPTFHPAYLLRNPAAKREVWDDLQAVMKQLGRSVPPAGRSA